MQNSTTLGNFDWKDRLTHFPAMNRVGKGFYYFVETKVNAFAELSISAPSGDQWIQYAQLIERCPPVIAAAASSAWNLNVFVAAPSQL